MKIRWIIVANTVTAKVYVNNPEDTNHLLLVTTLEHPEGLKKTQDLTSDRPGHYHTSHIARGSYEESDAHELEHDKFAHTIAHFLEHARTTNQFHALTLITAAHFHGLLEKHFTQPLQKTIDQVIQKNLIHLSEQELLNVLKNE